MTIWSFIEKCVDTYSKVIKLISLINFSTDFEWNSKIDIPEMSQHVTWPILCLVGPIVVWINLKPLTMNEKDNCGDN